MRGLSAGVILHSFVSKRYTATLARYCSRLSVTISRWRVGSWRPCTREKKPFKCTPQPPQSCQVGVFKGRAKKGQKRAKTKQGLILTCLNSSRPRVEQFKTIKLNSIKNCYKSNFFKVTRISKRNKATIRRRFFFRRNRKKTTWRTQLTAKVDLRTRKLTV